MHLLPDGTVLRRIRLLSPTEAVSTVHVLKLLRPQWQEINRSLQTLGKGVYLFEGDRTQYFSESKKNNPIIFRHFGNLLGLLRSRLEGILSDIVYFSEELALPGFHIFDFALNPSFSGGVLHVDRQYLSLPDHIPQRGSDKDYLSVTLALDLPLLGSGLDIFGFTLGSSVGMNNSRPASAAAEPHLSVTYAIGELLLFSSHLHHRIRPAYRCFPGDLRITLQSHLAKTKDGWLMYW